MWSGRLEGKDLWDPQMGVGGVAETAATCFLPQSWGYAWWIESMEMEREKIWP